MHVRLTGRRTVLGRSSRNGAAHVFRPPIRDKAGKIVTDSVYYVAEDAWSPKEKDEYLGALEVEVDAVERDAKGVPILKAGKPIPVLGTDGKQRKEWIASASGTRRGGTFEIVPDVEVAAVERKSKEAKAIAIAAQVKAGTLPKDAMTDYAKFLPPSAKGV